MNFIRELFEGDSEHEWIHNKFIKYSKGEFPGPRISIKKAGAFLKINSSADYVNILGMLLAGTFSGSLKVDGSIISREKIETYLETIGLDIVKARKKKGAFIYNVKGEADSKAIAELYSRLLDGVLLLNLLGDKVTLKVKKKLPKPGSKQNEKFCTGKLGQNERIVNEICFDVDVGSFKEIEISHRYTINELIIPEDCKDFSLARALAKRKGSVRRSVSVDGSVHETEKELLV